MLAAVALRKESVDRNKNFKPEVRDWFKVALRKESVDRNADGVVSGSADYVVALRKESVDRNIATRICEKVKNGRSPQGERG